ncbi:hypothetical protein QJS04_geneDACA005287 [Acorus gramineus]|uniref:Transmembrane protein n=1 Tax=Acorus gramineus TaxID=55184 RepID=A0AAV9AWS9_ACOGR|nr:hypothetical protein QJS04_geneDACA005287 [Acorus gramineus]
MDCSLASSTTTTTTYFFKYSLVSFSVLLLFLCCCSCFITSVSLASMIFGSSTLLYIYFTNKKCSKKAIPIEKLQLEEEIIQDQEDVGQVDQMMEERDCLENSISDNDEPCMDSHDDNDDDNESLIEIALSEGHDMSSTTEESDSLEFLLRQHGLMELLSDVGEENFIEIDISMGSIKCPRVEVEA